MEGAAMSNLSAEKVFQGGKVELKCEGEVMAGVMYSVDVQEEITFRDLVPVTRVGPELNEDEEADVAEDTVELHGPEEVLPIQVDLQQCDAVVEPYLKRKFPGVTSSGLLPELFNAVRTLTGW